MFCTLSLKPRDVRRLIKDLDEDPIVPRASEVEFVVEDNILKPYTHY